MRMLPPHVYKFKSKAEEKIFRVLEKVELKGNSDVALHSLNLSEHRYKQWAEADFVIVSPYGIYVLEVKGGRVAFRDGLWRYTNRYGVENTSSEGPFDQAKDARFSLETLLREKIGGNLVDNVCFGWGVVFPDQFFEGESVEMPNEIVFDARLYQRRSMERWLNGLRSYWSRKTGKSESLDGEQIKILVNAMRPEFDMVPALISRVGDILDEQVSLTEKQYLVLDALLANPRVLIEGGAGTGKSFLAAEASRRFENRDEKVLFLCRSPVFAYMMKNRLQSTLVHVIHYDELKEAIQRDTVPAFDMLVIDEGQDFLDIDCIEVIDSIIQGGLEKGHWLFFMDKNNQGSLYKSYDEDALGYLQSASFRFPLNQNCRNTQQIATQTMLYTGGDIGKCIIEGEGPPVDDSFVFNDRDEEKLAIEQQLSQWVDQEDVLLGHITIISPMKFENSVIQNLDRRWRKRLFEINTNMGDSWQDTMLTFSTVRDFKGLENRYIMLVDLENMNGDQTDISMLYVAMTRANAVLWIAVPEKVKYIIDDFKKHNSMLIVKAQLENRSVN